jgi:iron complex outermembrane receptor protein
VTWATYERDPRAGEIDTTDTQTPQRTLAERYNTRKSIDHKQAGLTWEQRFGANRLQVTAYGGNRRVVQYQAFSRGFQAPPTHSGGVVDFDRDFYGADLNWLFVRELAGGTLSTTVGIDTAARRTTARASRTSSATSSACAASCAATKRTSAQQPRSLPADRMGARQVGLTAGLRHSRLKVEVDDRYLSQRQRQRQRRLQPHDAGARPAVQGGRRP